MDLFLSLTQPYLNTSVPKKFPFSNFLQEIRPSCWSMWRKLEVAKGWNSMKRNVAWKPQTKIIISWFNVYANCKMGLAHSFDFREVFVTGLGMWSSSSSFPSYTMWSSFSSSQPLTKGKSDGGKTCQALNKIEHQPHKEGKCGMCQGQSAM